MDTANPPGEQAESEHAEYRAVGQRADLVDRLQYRGGDVADKERHAQRDAAPSRRQCARDDQFPPRAPVTAVEAAYEILHRCGAEGIEHGVQGGHSCRKQCYQAETHQANRQRVDHVERHREIVLSSVAAQRQGFDKFRVVGDVHGDTYAYQAVQHDQGKA